MIKLCEYCDHFNTCVYCINLNYKFPYNVAEICKHWTGEEEDGGNCAP